MFMPPPQGDDSPAESHVRQFPPTVAKVQRHKRAAMVALGALALTSGVAGAIETGTSAATNINAGRLAITLTGHGGFKLDTCTNDNSNYHDSSDFGSNSSDSSNNSNTIDSNSISPGNVNNDIIDTSGSTITYDYLDNVYGDVGNNNYDQVVNYDVRTVDDPINNQTIDDNPNSDIDNNLVNYYIDQNTNDISTNDSWTADVNNQTNNDNSSTFRNDELGIPEVYYQPEPSNVDFTYPDGSIIDGDSQLGNPFPSADYPKNHDYTINRPFDTYIFTSEDGDLIFSNDSIANYSNPFSRSEILLRSPSALESRPYSQENPRPQYPYERPYDPNSTADDSSSDDD